MKMNDEGFQRLKEAIDKRTAEMGFKPGQVIVCRLKEGEDDA
jgi:hypothetical protein